MSNRFCPQCGFSVAASERYCLKCGAEVREIVDNDEGPPSTDNADKHCDSSGASIDGAKDSAESEDQQGTSVADHPYPTPPPLPESESGLDGESGTLSERDRTSTSAVDMYESEVKPGEPPPDRMRPRTDEHQWQGRLFVGLGWAALVASGLSSLVVFLASLGEGSEAWVGFLVSGLAAGWAIFLYWLIRAVRDFDRRGWNALAVLLPLAGIGYLINIGTGGSAAYVAGAVIALTLTLIWAEYFWRIRHKYGKG